MSIKESYIKMENNIPINELIVFYYCISSRRDLRKCGSIHWKNSKSAGLTAQIKESILFFLSTCMVSNLTFPIDTKSVGVSTVDGKEEYYLEDKKIAGINYLSVFNPYEFTYLGYIPEMWSYIPDMNENFSI